MNEELIEKMRSVIAAAQVDAVLRRKEATPAELARAALGVAYPAIVEACAKVADEQALSWINGEASTAIGQAYQKGCREVASAIRNMAKEKGSL